MSQLWASLWTWTVVGVVGPFAFIPVLVGWSW
jgi:hypothetical protein